MKASSDGRGGAMSWGERLDLVWDAAGVEPAQRGYWTAWVRRFGKFIAPKKLYEGSQQEVEAFYQRMASDGRARWQLEDVDAALQVVVGEGDGWAWVALWSLARGGQDVLSVGCRPTPAPTDAPENAGFFKTYADFGL